jgi:hypothetical protein
MVRTLHRTPASERTHHTFDFLHGIDLERVHLRRPRGRLPDMLLGALLVFAVVAALALLLMVVRAPSPEAELELSAHDSGIAQALAVREVARQVTPHDSGIALRLRSP